jgi:hypothetical protein
LTAIPRRMLTPVVHPTRAPARLSQGDPTASSSLHHPQPRRVLTSPPPHLLPPPLVCTFPSQQSVTWEVPALKGNSPAPRSGHTFSVVGTKAYLFGGTGRDNGAYTIAAARGDSLGLGTAAWSSQGASRGRMRRVLRDGERSSKFGIQSRCQLWIDLMGRILWGGGGLGMRWV